MKKAKRTSKNRLYTCNFFWSKIRRKMRKKVHKFMNCKHHFLVDCSREKKEDCQHIVNEKKCGNMITNNLYCDEHYKLYLTGCKHIIKNGIRKEERCNEEIHKKRYCKNHYDKHYICKKCGKKRIKDGYCIEHYREIYCNNRVREENKEGCQWKMKAGPSIGQNCGKEIVERIYCKFHKSRK